MISRYPDLHQYNEKTKPFLLKRTTHKPVEIVFSKQAAGELGSQITLDGLGSSAEILLDFGKELAGSLELKLDVSSEAQIELFYGEEYHEAAREDGYQSSWYIRPKDSFNLSVGEQTVRSKGRKAWRFIRIRLLEGNCRVIIREIIGVLQHYPVIEKGSFSCSDEKLNRIWQISSYTTRLCMQQFYEDGIKRDGLLWVGDYRMEFLCGWHCFGDVELARKCLYLFAASQRSDGAIPACAGLSGGHQHPENIDYMPGIPHGFVDTWMILNYMTDFISCLWEYQLFTGDGETVRTLWPAAVRCMDYLLRRVNLKAPGLGVSMESHDPATIITDALPGLGGWSQSVGTFLFQLYKALTDAALLAEQYDDEDLLSTYKSQFSEMKKEIESRYYDGANRWFTDSDDHLTGSWHVNQFAVLSGFIEKEEGKALLHRIIEAEPDEPNAGFMVCWRNAALFETGMTSKALELIRRDWGKMLEHGATTCWERLDAPEFNREYPNEAPASLCHGWTAGPAYQFPRYLLGVRPAEPGYRQVVIQPDLGGIQWAEGNVPTPLGEIYVRWEPDASPAGIVRLPEGIEAVLIDSLGRTHSLHPGLNEI